MPVHATGHRQHIGDYHQRQHAYLPDHCLQEQLQQTATRMQQTTPRRPGALATLYASALLLTHVQSVHGSNTWVPGTTSRRPAMFDDLQTPSGQCLLNDTITAVTTRAAAPSTYLTQRYCEATSSVATPVTAKPHDVMHIDSALPTLPAAGRSSVWGMPLAEATPEEQLSALPASISPDETLTLDDETAKAYVIDQIRRALIDSGQLSEVQANRLEFQWRQLAAGVPLILAPITTSALQSRDKRISFSDHKKITAHHIKTNCAFETEILNSQGLSEGKLLLFKAQRAENPFRMLYDNIPGYEPNKAVRFIADGLNFVADVVTLSIKPLLGQLLANYYRYRYFSNLKDDICARRQLHLSFAQIATSIDVESAKFSVHTPHAAPHSAHHHSARKLSSVRPSELDDVIPLDNRAAFYARNPDTGVQTELLLITPGGTPGSTPSTVQEMLLLKPIDDAKYITQSMPPRGTPEKHSPAVPHVHLPANVDAHAHAHAHEHAHAHAHAHPIAGKRVVLDEKLGGWRYVDADDASTLTVNIMRGETFIHLNGERYPLRINRERQYSILARSSETEEQHLPVYQNPISKTWHLETLNRFPVFTPPQRTLIEHLRVPTTSHHIYERQPNQNPESYGNGPLIIVKDGKTERTLFNAVEMNGALIPVSTILVPNRAVRYEAFFIATPKRRGYPIEWDGERWHFEKWTSPHVSDELRQYIQPEMSPITLDVRKLSAPDRQGLRWDDKDNCYIKVKRRFVQIHKGKVSYFHAPIGKKVFVEYRDNQFHLSHPPLDIEALSLPEQEEESFYTWLTRDLKSKAPQWTSVRQIYNDTRALFLKQPTYIRQFPSNSLSSRHFVIGVGNSTHVLETTPTENGTVTVFLEGEQRTIALEKYRNRDLGGLVQHAIAMQRYAQEPLGLIPPIEKIEEITRQFVQDCYLMISDVLREHHQFGPTGKTLLLGSDDLFGGAVFATNAFASLSAAYQAWLDFFIPLSRTYPEVIIAPGSMSISQPVPALLRRYDNLYRQDGSEGRLADVVHLSADVAPVFHKGKLVTLARKGDYIRALDPATQDASDVLSLDTPIQKQQILNIYGVGNPLQDDPLDEVNSRLGTVFVGKTLLAGEHELTQKLFGPHRAATTNVSEETLFNNEFIIDGEKFLYIIGEEFQATNGFIPLCRRQAVAGNSDPDDDNRYDWILHAANTELLDAEMQGAADQYLAATRQNHSDYQSELTQRTPVTKEYPRFHLIVDEYEKE